MTNILNKQIDQVGTKALAGQSWLIQPVSVFSIYGLNLLVILVNFALAQLVMHWMDRKWQFDDVVPVDAKATRRWVLGTVLTLTVWIGFSLAGFIFFIVY